MKKYFYIVKAVIRHVLKAKSFNSIIQYLIIYSNHYTQYPIISSTYHNVLIGHHSLKGYPGKVNEESIIKNEQNFLFPRLTSCFNLHANFSFPATLFRHIHSCRVRMSFSFLISTCKKDNNKILKSCREKEMFISNRDATRFFFFLFIQTHEISTSCT